MSGGTSSTGQTSTSPSNTRSRLPPSLLARTTFNQGQQPSSATSPNSSSPDSAPGEKPVSIETSIAQLAATSLSGASEDGKKSDESSKEKAPRGYKNVPSLEAITARMALSRAQSADGPSKETDVDGLKDMKKATTAPADLEDGEVEDLGEGKQPKDTSHPLQHTW